MEKEKRAAEVRGVRTATCTFGATAKCVLGVGRRLVRKKKESQGRVMLA
jgi:hypothetical protein